VITGEPIIRPLWWINNSDIQTYTIDNQFLVGNDILVAPIVNENKYEQNIYIPNGSWQHFNGTIYTGPGWFRNFQAPIDVINYFIFYQS
jgi:alpha-glucosidase (family GH31 glycosyl hydrolase)